MKFREVPDNGQSQAKAAVRPRDGGFGLAKSFKYARQKFWIYSHASIANLEFG
jgi:hypothetical protein